MANTLLTPTIVAKAALAILDNELKMANHVYRAYESEFRDTYNGYKIGSTLNIRKPAQFTIRTGSTASIQDVIEGFTQLTVSPMAGVDFAFTTTELTLSIGELSERILKPAMVQVANKIDLDIMANFQKVWNTVGTPGVNISTFGAFMAGARKLNEGAVPADGRVAMLSPIDHAALLGSQTALYIQGAANPAYRDANLGMIADVATMMTQNVPVLTTGTRTNGTVNGAGQVTVYGPATANTYTQTLIVAGLGAAATVSAGETFTLAGVFGVNPVTKAKLSNLQTFTVVTAAVADGAGGATLTISPQIILTPAAFQNVFAAPANGAILTWSGAASTAYNQNLMFAKNAFALAVLPLEIPPGVGIGATRQSYKGISARIIPYYNGTTDLASWRLDILYATAAIDPRLATRVYG